MVTSLSTHFPLARLLWKRDYSQAPIKSAPDNACMVLYFSSVSIGVTTGGTFCGVVGHKNRHEYSGM